MNRVHKSDLIMHALIQRRVKFHVQQLCEKLRAPSVGPLVSSFEFLISLNFLC